MHPLGDFFRHLWLLHSFPKRSHVGSESNEDTLFPRGKSPEMDTASKRNVQGACIKRWTRRVAICQLTTECVLLFGSTPWTSSRASSTPPPRKWSNFSFVTILGMTPFVHIFFVCTKRCFPAKWTLIFQDEKHFQCSR